MREKASILLILPLLLFFTTSKAQEVGGVVTDENGNKPMVNVSIIVQGTNLGTSTGTDGNFKILVPSLNDTLIFTFVGYEGQKVPLRGKRVVNVSMRSISTEMQEVVISGYQTARRSDITGSISSLSKKDLQQISSVSVSSPIEALQGRLPGVNIQENGDPTGAPVVRIRGVNTLNDNDPLYVIDGMSTREQNVIQLLNPLDIESIQVLKDGMSASIYGSRASNGVILITTKKALRNKFSIQYSSQLSLTDWNTKPDLLNTMGRATAQWRAAVNDGIDPNTISDIQYDWTQNPDGSAVLNKITLPALLAPGYIPSDTYWPDVISRKGLVQNHSILVSSGGERGGTLMSFRYYRNKYILKYRDYDKYSARINSHYFLTKDHKIEVGENIAFTNGTDNGLESATINGVYSLRPILPVFTTDGKFSGPPSGLFADNSNTLMDLFNGRENKNQTLYFLGNVYARIKPMKNLTINSNYGFNASSGQQRIINRRYQAGTRSENQNSLINSENKFFEWNFNISAEYRLNMGDNSFTFLGGTEATEVSFSQFSAQRFDFAVEDLPFLVLDAGSGNQIVTGAASGSKLHSYFGKISYSYKSKYLLNVTTRIDGSSIFGIQNQYGTFPSISGGWRLASEPFIKDNLPFISELKLRGGWGETGNQSISPNARFGLFTPSYGSLDLVNPPWRRSYSYANYATSYDLNGAGSGTLASGFRRIQTGNERLKWETTRETDFGLDYGFFGNKLFGAFTYFIRNTRGILITPVVVAARGEGSQEFFNGASVRSKGWELDITYQNNFGKDFSLTLQGNISHSSNKITELPTVVAHTFPGNSEQTIIDHSINSIFGYVADGLFTSQDEVDHSAVQPGKGVGRLRFADLNDDGVINSLDQIYLSTGDPKLEFGFGATAIYKRFNLSFFFQGLTGLKLLDGQKLNDDFTGLYAGTNYGPRVLEAWTTENINSAIPAISLSDRNDEGRISSYFIANASYAKLRQVVFGYTFTNIPHISNLNVFIQGENLLIIKDHSWVGKDPEDLSILPSSTSAVLQSVRKNQILSPLPRPRTVSLGVNITF